MAAIFAAAAVVIGLAGPRMTAFADIIAERLRMGEALTGGLFLGGTTSLPGIVTSVTTAAYGFPELAISNAIGGIAAQTTFLGIADMAYRRANLEHSAASLVNIFSGTLLITLLAIPLVAMAAPDVAVFGVSPATVLLIAGYVFGMRMASAIKTEPMWSPLRTRETQVEEDEEADHGGRSTARLLGGFALLGAATALAGFAVAESGVELAQRTGLSQSAVGALFTAVVTSLPELVTSVAAVRRGALNLAVGGILGGNAFDVLFLAFADVAYRPGSIYEAFSDKTVLIISATLLMTGTLLLGLLRREKWGVGGIGFESTLILAMYAIMAVLLVT